jgi:hypothetical protein
MAQAEPDRLSDSKQDYAACPNSLAAAIVADLQDRDGWGDYGWDGPVHPGHQLGDEPAMSPDSGEKHFPSQGAATPGVPCSRAWVYPELPWGAPPSWSKQPQFGGTFLVYWELLTCLACVYVAITVPYIAGIDEAKGEYSLFGDCVLLQIVELHNGKSDCGHFPGCGAMCKMCTPGPWSCGVLTRVFLRRQVAGGDSRDGLGL